MPQRDRIDTAHRSHFAAASRILLALVVLAFIANGCTSAGKEADATSHKEVAATSQNVEIAPSPKAVIAPAAPAPKEASPKPKAKRPPLVLTQDDLPPASIQSTPMYVPARHGEVLPVPVQHRMMAMGDYPSPGIHDPHEAEIPLHIQELNDVAHGVKSLGDDQSDEDYMDTLEMHIADHIQKIKERDALNGGQSPRPRYNIEKLNTLVSLEFTNADIQNVLRLLSHKMGVNIYYSEDVRGVVDIRVKDIPLGDALTMMLDPAKYRLEQVGDGLAVYAVAPQR